LRHLKNTGFWDVTPCGSWTNLIRATRRNIPEHDIFRSHPCENLKSQCVSCEEWTGIFYPSRRHSS
jgi:hypothetical protein